MSKLRDEPSQSENFLDHQIEMQKQIVVSGAFDDVRSRDLRFLEEAAKLGILTVLLWPDAAVEQRTGNAPKFPSEERLYFLNSVRYINRVIQTDASVNFDS